MRADVPEPERWADRPARLAATSSVGTAFRRARQATEPSEDAVARLERRGLAGASAGVGRRWWRAALVTALLATIAGAVGAAGRILSVDPPASPASARTTEASVGASLKKRLGVRGRLEAAGPELAAAPVAPAAMETPQPSEQRAGSLDARALPASAALSSSSSAVHARAFSRTANPTEASLLASALRSLRTESDMPAALAALDRYDQLFPRGALRGEAQLARTEVLMRSGRRAEALPLLVQLEEIGGPMTRNVLASRGELYAEGGRCSNAVRDFDRVLAGPEQDDAAARALYGRAACRLRAGEVAAGRRDLELYLASYPRGAFAPSARQALEGPQ
jgi:tetratricopeptide (TPR) repeat protein